MNRNDNSKLLILTYHYIRDPHQYPYAGIHPVSLLDFSAQLKGLKKTFHVATPQELEGFFNKDLVFERPAVFFTFDDGLIDHSIAAQEVLDQLDIKGAFFISTKPITDSQALTVHKIHWLRAATNPSEFRKQFFVCLDKKRPKDSPQTVAEARQTYPYDTPEDAVLKYWINYQLPADIVDQACNAMLRQRAISEKDFCKKTYLSKKQIINLHNNGHTIGLHGHTHIPFSALTRDSLTTELKTSISCLKGLTGAKPSWLSYPYGMRWFIPMNIQEKLAVHNISFGFMLDKTDLGWNSGNESNFFIKRINPNDADQFIG